MSTQNTFKIMIICAVASIISTSCNNSNRTAYADRNLYTQQDTDTIESLSITQEPAVTQETPAVTQEPQKSWKSKFVGTYTVTDKLNHTWIFKINADETATIQQKGSDGIVYASCNFYSDGEIRIDCDDKKPVIVFPNLDEMFGMTKIRDGYLYADYSAASSKNPERRLKITKTN